MPPSLKGKNTWIRPGNPGKNDDQINRSNPSVDGKGIKVGKYKLVRSPSVLKAEREARKAALESQALRRPPPSSPTARQHHKARYVWQKGDKNAKNTTATNNSTKYTDKSADGKKDNEKPSSSSVTRIQLNGKTYSKSTKSRSLSLHLQPSPATAALLRHRKKAAIAKSEPSSSVVAAKKPAIQSLHSTRQSTMAKVKAREKNRSQLARIKPSVRLKGPPTKFCLPYCRTGICKRRSKCDKVHDPTKRAVCTKWLMGKCHLDAKHCPLQHQKKHELMPSCVHFLQGQCKNEHSCPWLHSSHVKADAPPCTAFLKGYCSAGDKCAMKHYTLSQIKEEHRLVGNKKGIQQSGTSGGTKTKKGRYFDSFGAESENDNDDDNDNRNNVTVSDDDDELDNDDDALYEAMIEEDENSDSDQDSDTLPDIIQL